MIDETTGGPAGDPAGLDRSNAERAKQLAALDRLSQRFGTSLSGAFAHSATAGRQLDGVLGRVGTSLANAATRAIAKPVRSGIEGAVRGLLDAGTGGDAAEEAAAFARGGVLGRGRVRAFAAGGVVASPTYFPMAGGAGLMGEAGPEAIMPLARGADGRLGVAAPGAAGRPVSVTVNIATPDVAGFRRSEAGVAAALARAVARGRRGT